MSEEDFDNPREVLLRDMENTLHAVYALADAGRLLKETTTPMTWAEKHLFKNYSSVKIKGACHPRRRREGAERIVGINTAITTVQSNQELS